MTGPLPVVIYRDELLPPSETFIRDQAEALVGFVPYYVGSRVVGGPALPAERTITVSDGGTFGRLSEAAHKGLGLAPALRRRLERLRPVLIHAHFGPGGTMALPLAQHLGVPLLVTFHGYDLTVSDDELRRASFPERLYVDRRAELRAGGSRFLAVSRFLRDRLLAQGYPPDRVLVHYIGVDLDRFRSDADVPREPIVLFVGRLVEVKGCEYLIRAMALVQDVHRDAELVVIGDGPLRESLESLARAELRACRFLGAQPPDIIRAWMNRARVLSVPSVTAASGATEAFGLVFAEAQAMGLPVVSFASGGIPEAVEHGVTGFLGPERDWSWLAGGIGHLLSDATVWERFSAAGPARMRARFELRACTAGLEAIYRSVLPGRRVGAVA